MSFFSDFENTVTQSVSYESGGTSLDLSGLTGSDTFPSFTIPGLDFRSDFTMECFTNRISGISTPCIFYASTDHDVSGSASLQLKDQSYFNISRGSFNSPPTAVSDSSTVGVFNSQPQDFNVWVHQGISYDSTTGNMVIFRDGLVKTVSYAPDVDVGSKVLMGTDLNGVLFSGYISHVRVSDVARYTAAYTVPDPTTWSSGDANVIMLETTFAIPITLDTVTISSVYVVLSWGTVEEGTNYRITSVNDTSGISTTVTTHDLSVTIKNLEPGTTYTLTLSSGTSNAFTDVATSSVTTLTNTSVNFDSSVFQDSDGNIDLSGFSSITMDSLSSILNEVFSTDDIVNVVDENGYVHKTSFLNINGVGYLNTVDSGAILIPFDDSLGSGQKVTISLSDNTSYDITFDDTLGSINLGGVSYSSGQVFILDGKKVSFSNI